MLNGQPARPGDFFRVMIDNRRWMCESDLERGGGDDALTFWREHDAAEAAKDYREQFDRCGLSPPCLVLFCYAYPSTGEPVRRIF